MLLKTKVRKASVSYVDVISTVAMTYTINFAFMGNALISEKRRISVFISSDKEKYIL